MAGQSLHFRIGQNDEQWFYVPFPISQVIIDNPGSYWVHFPEAWGGYAFVWPQRFGASVPAPIATPGNLHVSTKDTPPGQTPAGASSAIATLTVYEDTSPLQPEGAQPAPSFNPGQALQTLDTVAGDIQPTLASAPGSAGAVGLAADAAHRHPGWLPLVVNTQKAGPLTQTWAFTTTYANSGVYGIIRASAIKITAVGLLHLAFNFDSGAANDRTMYADAFGPSHHVPFPPIPFYFANAGAAGAHNIGVFVNDVNTSSDANDVYQVDAWEVPQ